MYEPTRSERREKKRKNLGKMKESGRSVKLLQEIIVRKAKKAKERLRQYGDNDDIEPNQ